MARDTLTLTRPQVAAEGWAGWEHMVDSIEATDDTGGFATGLVRLAVLGYVVPDDEAVVDPDGRQVELWFQDSDAREPDRQRFHRDITVPPDQAQARIDAAVAAGGTVVSTDRAPAFTVVADPQGHHVCVCTWQGRDQD
jgi:4a-hydroxytetrahydrobiopterin dehydratase